jgi:hypothetical protein
MESEDFYLLFSKVGNSESVVDFFCCTDSKLMDVIFDYELEKPYKKWHLKKTSLIFDVDNKDALIDELFKKSPIYSQNQNLKDYYRIERIKVTPGEYSPRIYRPHLLPISNLMKTQRIDGIESELFQLQDYLPLNYETAISATHQLATLIDELEYICRMIHPSQKNFAVFGHEIRNLLILACTEVEAQLRGIYVPNSNTSKKSLTMKEYCSLNKVLSLDKYAVFYSLYPWLDNFRPFQNWGLQNQTQLTWYQAYNAVKHDRENEFESANLENVLEAIAAVAILLYAQYGEKLPFRRELIGDFFNFVEVPKWDINQYYLPPHKGESWRPTKALN